MARPLRPLTRALSLRHFSSAPAPASSYPFNPSAIPRPSTTPLPPPPALLHPKNGWSLITHLNNAAPPSPWAHLFARRSKDRLPAGSVLTVLTYTDAAKKSVSPFSGVLMGTKRRGVDTSFRLRNIVNKAGVEMTFKLNSPMIKEIRVVKRAERAKGQLKDLKRAKVNYLRDRPAVMAAIARALKTAKQNEAAAAES
ncbi:large subunit ribosomal protein L19 [Cryptococcus neoformans var. grubii H99]|uniref:Large subunit ribosomal protein L19 n=1 Tax=Cryptococcus neoformans (strain H99 / ATCC 208821 / CBS 10515 / FGSC 9487) TaxID=235443 RepID=J9W020_CRYN9|nr:large subunit ribosomal protein L19 [Cryptococcus neoformans var. grubii H99]AFR99066.1 large subunit ribosomal protein L19 [Cryptococcus neoformans var. grubii H99]AUB29295.1 large subunit ribosomal protein L19 [Cryptococcus neoformans var. grubii]OXG32561.1 ribosomal protein L19 [Cryptococcus neoformans var. grubii Bt120]|eukprot:XP_012053894.1 large subunit ribosomal protein L19 [Cryptococcus neoformans var. grubii H99]